jgi:hypothetical protein
LSKAVRALIKKLGSKKAAERLRVSPRALRAPSKSLATRAEIAWKRTQAAVHGWETRRYNLEERAAIQEEPRIVPGYGPQKLARVLQDLRHLRGENWIEHQDAKYAARALEKRNLPVDPKLYEEMARLERLDANIRKLEFHMAPSQTIEERLYKVENIDREYREISRMFNLSARAVYSLYYSPPAGATG